MRERLPDRRPNLTVELEFEGRLYAVTVGYCPETGAPREVFCGTTKTGSAIDALLADWAVTTSMLLQLGHSPAALAASMGRVSGQAPASVIGAIADLVATEAVAGGVGVGR